MLLPTHVKNGCSEMSLRAGGKYTEAARQKREYERVDWEPRGVLLDAALKRGGRGRQLEKSIGMWGDLTRRSNPGCL